MGLTNKSTGINTIKGLHEISTSNNITIALAGNPNTGKSTIFNNLTKMNQHTGNWPGKTVVNATGKYKYNNNQYVVVDLPGTYSLLANSAEEEVARDFICFDNPNVTVVVADATCLERNLNLVLQILEITDKVVLCINLMDEAKRKKIKIDIDKLSNILGIPVIGTTARSGKGLDKLKEKVEQIAFKKTKTNPIKINYNEDLETAIEIIKPYIYNSINNKINNRWLALRLIDGDSSLLKSLNEYFNFNINNEVILKRKLKEANFNLKKDLAIDELRDLIVSNIIKKAENISKEVIFCENKTHNHTDRKIDNILTSKYFGIPTMLLLLSIILWITIKGANYPSELLSNGLFYIEGLLTKFFGFINAPSWLHGILVLGIYRTLAWVVSVMLPPMAIFFPLFTLLEDLGYLPRVAFNLDHFFKKACAHGKQALTMCMGFGCNAAGVIACRIIDSPRERLIAIITNNFVPCNGRFPTLIALATIFIAGTAGTLSTFKATLTILVAIILAIIITLFMSKLLSKTILKGLPSSFTLELPPYRKPQIGKVIIHSLFDRTLFVLSRAIIIAAPAGLVIWLMANITIGNNTILTHCALFLDPFSKLIGLDGYIMMAFILGLPANEIVIPILIMGYMSKGSMLELNNLNEMRELFINNDWTLLTAVCTMLFSLNHFPCGTTLLTIKKETKSLKWTLISFIIPTIVGILLCFIVTQSVRLLNLIF